MQFTQPRYDRLTIILHWLTALLVVLLWGIAQIIDDFPKGPLRVDARSAHITLGVTLVVVLLVRLFHRATAGRKLPPADRGVLHIVAKAVHYALYLLVAGQLALGLTLAWFRGDSLWNLYTLPGGGPANHDFSENLSDIHGTVATIILIVAGVHAAAALVHHFLWKDGTLRRMLPGA